MKTTDELKVSEEQIKYKLPVSNVGIPIIKT